jgi:hypothetical protein
MKTTARLMYLLGISFLLVDVAYFVWSLIEDNFELIGLMTIGLSGMLCLFFGFYFGRVVKGGGPIAWVEDNPEADVDDGDSEMGYFSPWSWWPILLAGAITIVTLGAAISAWIAFIGLPLLAVTLVGWQFEYYRGHHAR